MKESIVKYGNGITMEDLEDEEKARALCKKHHIELMEGWTLGHYITALFDELVEANLQQPTFITSYPAVVSPLARRTDSDPEFTDRFEFFIGGREIGNGFSDYINAMQYGLPPTAGEGIGIDRTVMLFTNAQTIRDVILFPTLRRN